MKTIQFLSILMIAMFIILSCQKQDTPDSPEFRQTNPESKSPAVAASNRTIEYFRANLNKEMNYDQIVTRFGIPDGDIGSGFHIYVYNLADGTQVRIVYAYDKIQAVVQVDPKEKNPDKVLSTLI